MRISEAKQHEYILQRLRGTLSVVAFQKMDPTHSFLITVVDPDIELYKQCEQEHYIPVYESISQWVKRTKKPKRKR